MFKRHVTHYSLCLFCLFLISMFTVACGSTSTNAVTQPKPTATPSPIPTVSLTTYKGDGYTIGYPTGWKVSTSTQQTQISDAAQDNLLVESKTAKTVSSSTSALTVQFALAAMKVGEKNYKDVSTSAKTTIGGTSWDQGAATMTDPQSGPIEFVVLATQSPTHPGQLVVLIYGTSQKTFVKINAEDFQPMLESFKFQS